MTSSSVKTVSLYIPIVSKNITEYYVKQQFFQHKIGSVQNVDFVFNNQKNRREAFIHFKCWFDNKKAKDLLLDIKNEETKTQFIYYNKKFWPLLINKSSKDSKNENYVIEKKENMNVKQVKDQLQDQPHDQNQVQNHLKEKLKEEKLKEEKLKEKEEEEEKEKEDLPSHTIVSSKKN